MRTLGKSLVLVSLMTMSSCGLELIARNFSHQPHERPASKLRGTVALPGATVKVFDADGKELTPFQNSQDGGTEFELRLPSANYSNLVLTAASGNASLRALIPAVNEESTVDVDIDARMTAEALISEASLSAKGITWKQVTPDTYRATAGLIQEAFDRPGPAQDFVNMVSGIVSRFHKPNFGGGTEFFLVPVLDSTFKTTSSGVDPSWVDRENPDLDGDGTDNRDSSVFDNLLVSLAKSYHPAGCPDANQIRIVFTVDFNTGRKNGNCGVSERFKWATDKPGKSMYFVGWIHKESPIQDPLVSASLGNGSPNQIPMKDDGTLGDETAGDNIWTVYFDVPRGVRIGYKYTWGTRGAPWTGSEEWPGNSRIIEAVDVNGDDLIYRRDVFADEATNKDRSNLNTSGTGSVDWTTDLRGGIEAREMQVDTDNDCTLDTWVKPTAIGPLTVVCTQ